jgi:3-phenylpropionate/cinnamic acid dioxygenase small subunit
VTDRVQELCDRLDIAEVLARYCDALDQRRWELLAAVFAADASADYGSVGTPTGVEAIASAIRNTIENLDATQHLIGNVQVQVQGDTATAQCYLISQHVRAGQPGGEEYLLGGRYVDELARTPDGWRITFRRLDRMWTSGNRDVVRRATPPAGGAA